MLGPGPLPGPTPGAPLPFPPGAFARPSRRARGVPSDSLLIAADDALAVQATAAVQAGDRDALERLLATHPELARARFGDEDCSRTLLHAATDWPGHFPNGPAVVERLVQAGADVNARWFGDPAPETPLHWAASSNDVAVLDALLDAGADIEASGAVLGGGSPLADACGFGSWAAAHRLVERGARTRLKDAAALGLIERVRAAFAESAPPEPDEITHAFWSACHGGQRQTGEFLLEQDADLNWVGWDDLTPLDAAARSQADALVGWLRGRGQVVRRARLTTHHPAQRNGRPEATGPPSGPRSTREP